VSRPRDFLHANLAGQEGTAFQRFWVRLCRPFLLGLIFLCPAATNSPLGETPLTASDAQLAPQNVRTKSDKWVPPDVDSVRPPVAILPACSLSNVVSNVGARIETLYDNLNRVTATETTQHETVSRSGTLQHPENYRIDYTALVESTPAGYLSLQEYRGPNQRKSDLSSDHIATGGVFAFTAIFHPNYTKGYQMACEGLGMWRDQPAWLVRFEELPDDPRHLSQLVMKGKSYSLNLRGRAWILADSYQLVRLETDIARPIPEIKLRIQHEIVEYIPFRTSSERTLMLPSTVEIYMDFLDHRFYRRITYDNFQVFSVNVHEEFGNLNE
jgi:hypothetical protein